EFARVAGNPALVAETKIVRIKVEGEEQLDELKRRVNEAAGRLDPDVKEPGPKKVEVKEAEAKESPDVAEPEAKEPEAKEPRPKKPSRRRAKAEDSE
ncbi:MAG: hypothetical protein ABI614_01650, partial [Planctomycetota bacterium]